MKYEIDIEGLPEGWKAVAYRQPKNGEHYFYNGRIETAHSNYDVCALIIVEKIQPCRIVLEQIPMDSVKLGDFMRPPGSYALLPVGSEGYNESYAFLREVNETDITQLTNSSRINDD